MVEEAARHAQHVRARPLGARRGGDHDAEQPRERGVGGFFICRVFCSGFGRFWRFLGFCGIGLACCYQRT